MSKKGEMRKLKRSGSILNLQLKKHYYKKNIQFDYKKISVKLAVVAAKSQPQQKSNLKLEALLVPCTREEGIPGTGYCNVAGQTSKASNLPSNSNSTKSLSVITTVEHPTRVLSQSVAACGGSQAAMEETEFDSSRLKIPKLSKKE